MTVSIKEIYTMSDFLQWAIICISLRNKTHANKISRAQQLQGFYLSHVVWSFRKASMELMKHWRYKGRSEENNEGQWGRLKTNEEINSIKIYKDWRSKIICTLGYSIPVTEYHKV